MSENKQKKTSIGGQALIEGIMMRGPKKTAMAVRNLKGEIVTEEWDTSGKQPAKIWKLPIFRGMYGMYTSLTLGYKCLMKSAMLSGIDELEEMDRKEKELKKLNKQRKKQGLPELESLPEEKEESEIASQEASAEPTKEDAPAPEMSTPILPEGTAENVDCSKESIAASENTQGAEDILSEENDALETEAVKPDTVAFDKESAATAKTSEKEEKKDNGGGAIVAIAATIGTVLGILLAIGLFVFLPAQIYTWTIKNSVETSGMSDYPRMLVRSLFEGVLRIALFVLYMVAVSLMKDIRKTFEYHGAEHKTIFCYEAGLPLTVENIRKMKRFHPRCGTSFMIVMLVLGIVIGSFIPEFHVGTNIVNNLLRSLCKIGLLPIVVGLGYEFIKYAGRHENLLVKILAAPGLWMQRVSVKEPTDEMIECAIVAMEKVIPNDGSDCL